MPSPGTGVGSGFAGHHLAPVDRHGDFLCFAVYSANLAFGRVYRPILAKLGLTYTQYVTLVALECRSCPRAQSGPLAHRIDEYPHRRHGRAPGIIEQTHRNRRRRVLR